MREHHLIIETSYGEVLVKPHGSQKVVLECYVGDNFDCYVGNILGHITGSSDTLAERIERLF